MKPIDQTRFDKNGNCMSACVASVFELTLGEVPDLHEEDWNEILGEWLAQRGLALFWILNKQGSGAWELMRKGGHLRDAWCIAGGESPRGLKHAVVWRHGQVQHDPHPSREGLVGKPEDFSAFILLDPARS